MLCLETPEEGYSAGRCRKNADMFCSEASVWGWDVEGGFYCTNVMVFSGLLRLGIHKIRNWRREVGVERQVMTTLVFLIYRGGYHQMGRRLYEFLHIILVGFIGLFTGQ